MKRSHGKRTNLRCKLRLEETKGEGNWACQLECLEMRSPKAEVLSSKHLYMRAAVLRGG